MRSALALSVAAAATLLVSSACSGAAPSELLTSPPSTGGTVVDASATSDATTGGSPDVAAMQEPDSSTDDDGSTGSVEAGSMDATAVDVAAETGSQGVPCTNGTTKSFCQGSDVCCITTLVTSTGTCEASGACFGGSVVRCGSSADCPMAQVCCSTQASGGFAPTYDVSCAANCTGLGKTQLCDPNGPPGGCPNGETCSATTSPAGYSGCN